MTTINIHKISFCFLSVFVFMLLYPAFAIAENKPQRVLEVCECKFPAEVGAFKHLKVIQVRYTILSYASLAPVMVREIFARRNGDQYRIISMVESTETSTVGKEGPVIEVAKWNGPYWPSEVLYQLPPDKLNYASASLKKD